MNVCPQVKGKGTHEAKAQMARAYPCFLSVKHLGVLLLPPGQDASPLQGYPPPSSMSPVPIYTPGLRETMWSKVSCLRKQHDGRGLNPIPLDPEFEVLTAHTCLCSKSTEWFSQGLGRLGFKKRGKLGRANNK